MVHKVRSTCNISRQTVGSVVIAATVSGLLAACSADISRFNFNDKTTTTGALPDQPTPSEPVYGSRSALGRPADPAPAPYDAVERQRLNQPVTGSRYDTPSRYDTSRVNTAPGTSTSDGFGGRGDRMVQPIEPDYSRQPEVLNAPARDVAASPSTAGGQITVRRGDTLYGLSRRHGTTVTALMEANNLNSSALQPGQKLYLPSGARQSQTSNPYGGSAQNDAPLVTSEAPAHWNDTYTIQSGDSLYRLSRRYNVKISDLKRYNSIRNPRALKPGMVLKVPGPGGDNGTIAASVPNRNVTARRADTRPIAGSPTILNGAGSQPNYARETQVAAVKPTTTTDAGRSSTQSMTVRPSSTRQSIAGASKLRWPVRGRIVSGFGKRNDGTHNDGINVAVPLGTNIHAAESGMVAYAGDELKGYGNLVLIRHDNGWVTAYAHAEKLLVKRGDRIRRGDVIAKAGRTGDVAQPQVHFEVRQGQKPVDPIPFMDRL